MPLPYELIHTLTHPQKMNTLLQVVRISKSQIGLSNFDFHSSSFCKRCCHDSSLAHISHPCDEHLHLRRRKCEREFRQSVGHRNLFATDRHSRGAAASCLHGNRPVHGSGSANPQHCGRRLEESHHLVEPPQLHHGASRHSIRTFHGATDEVFALYESRQAQQSWRRRNRSCLALRKADHHQPDRRARPRIAQQEHRRPHPRLTTCRRKSLDRLTR